VPAGYGKANTTASERQGTMTTTPDSPTPSQDESEDVVADPSSQKTPGAEIGMSPGEGTTFEPEEDPESQD
jgi:hypothetical protein